METEAKYTYVGLFVIILGIALIASILWISGARDHRETTEYLIFFERHSLEGLSIDSDVTMKGVAVGKVKSYQISGEDIEKVQVFVEVNESTPIKKDTQAVVRRNLLTGLARIDLVGSTNESPQLREPAEGREYPVIPEGQTRLERIADSVPAVLEEVNKAVIGINEVLSEKNVEALGQTIQNTEAFTKTLKEEREEIVRVIDQIGKITSEIHETSKAIRDTSKRAQVDFKELSEETKAVMGELRTSVKTLDREAKQISTSFQNSSSVFAQEMSHLSREISIAADAISRAMDEFENPRKILTGPSQESLGPGETR